jgi:hypothetical protein
MLRLLHNQAVRMFTTGCTVMAIHRCGQGRVAEQARTHDAPTIHDALEHTQHGYGQAFQSFEDMPKMDALTGRKQ